MKQFKYFVYPILIVVLFGLKGCGSSQKTSSFEQILYPEGKGFTIRQVDEFTTRRFDFYFLEALRLKMLGDQGNAAVYFTEALKLDSTCATCFFEIGNLLIQSREFIQAEEYIFKAVQIDPLNQHFLFLLSKLYLHNGKGEYALKSIKYLINQHPDNIEYLYHAAQTSFGLERYQDAIFFLNKIEGLLGTNDNLSLEKHNVYVAAGESKNAERELVRLIDHFPGNSLYKIYLGDYYIQRRQLKKAIDIYRTVLEDDSSNGHVFFSLANYYLTIGDTSNFKSSLLKGFSSTSVDLEAKAQRLLPFLMGIDDDINPLKYDDFNLYFDVLTRLHPHEYEIFLLHGNYLQHIKQDSLAAKAFETALLIDEKQEVLWHDYLLLVFAHHGNDAALQNALRAVNVYPENGFFQYLAGFAYLLNQNNEDALTHMSRVPNLAGSNVQLKAQALGLLGDMYYQTGDPEKSFESYQLSLDINENNVVVLNNYAYYLSLERKNLSKAEQMISRVIELEPLNYTYLDTYAWVLFKMEKYFDALFIIEQAINAGGDSNGVILEHYGDILYKNGDSDKALLYWIKASETDDDVTELLPKKISEKRYIAE
jgi:tetratricopeptide (TPR) repeat protein